MPIKVPNSSNSRLNVSYPRPKKGGTVIFEDTFTTLDTAKWKHRTGWMAPTVMAWNDYASNATTVVDSALAPELYSISGGVLSLSARRSVAGDATAINSALSWSGQTMRDWLGPMMISSETFTYGHFQFRARVPSPTKGMFPGIWFYGAQDGSAPPEKQQVEIDLWELFGYPSGKPISTTIHYHNSSNEAERPSLSVGHWDVDTTGWHVYALDWQPTYLRFWYDDILLAEVTGDDATWLNVPMRILMQAMVGAAWFPSGHAADETTASPNGMELDYVRVHSVKEAFSSAPSDAPVIGADGADGKVTLSMDQGDFVARAVSYEIQRSDDGTSGWTAVDDRWFASLDVAATNGSLIYFRARAKNAAGVGPWSTVVSAVARTAIVPPDWGSNLDRWSTGSVSPWALSGGELTSSTGSWTSVDLILQEWMEVGVTYTVTINCTLPAGYINVGPNGGVASFDATDQALANGSNTLTWTMAESVPRFCIRGESNGFVLHSISIEETAAASTAGEPIGLLLVLTKAA